MMPLESMGPYATVVVDPPWPLNWYRTDWTKADAARNGRVNRGKYVGKRPGYSNYGYETMDVDEIAALPVGDVLADDALVFLWTTGRLLREAFGVLEAWGVVYGYTMVWHKPWGPKPLNKPMYNSEFVLVGTKGKPRYTDEKMFFTANTWTNPRVHSRKPEEFYDLLRRVTPAPRLDIFGRRRIGGFDTWGDQAPAGPPLPETYQQVLVEPPSPGDETP